MSDPIELYMVDVNGRKSKFTKSLQPKEKQSADTFFTHPWLFRESGRGKRLHAYASGVSNSIFEGAEFGAKNNSVIHIIISNKGISFLMLFNIRNG